MIGKVRMDVDSDYKGTEREQNQMEEVNKGG